MIDTIEIPFSPMVTSFFFFFFLFDFSRRRLVHYFDERTREKERERKISSFTCQYLSQAETQLVKSNHFIRSSLTETPLRARILSVVVVTFHVACEDHQTDC